MVEEMTPKGVCLNTGRTHFRKGHLSWLKGTKGLVKPNSGSFKKGHKNPHRFNHGLCLDKKKNRWLIWCRDNTYQIFARAVMECHLKRELRSSEIVHHENENSIDDEIENLKIVTRAEHQRLHKPRLGKVKAL